MIKPRSSRGIPGWRLLTTQRNVTDAIISHRYAGGGTEADPYRVEWLPDDPVDPLNYAGWRKWTITIVMATSTLAIAFASSALSGADPQIETAFAASSELVTADVSLFVLSFAIGPAIWGPLSELYGRQIVFAVTYTAVTLFGAAAIASKNIATLLVLRFFMGAFGASIITNAAGVISDLFTARERGLGLLTVPETYAPVLLKQRAVKLSQLTGMIYKSKLEVDGGTSKSAQELFKVAMVRPWVLLAREPIVSLLSIYIAIIYGTLYLSFAAFPIVFAEHRGWNQGVSGLSFISIMIGQTVGMVYAVFDTTRYKRIADRSPGGRAQPEAWLAPSLVGAVALPVGLFWFAWTNGNNVNWIVSLIGIAPFGFGQVLVFLSLNQYLIDAYGVYAASALAANASIRALVGAAFPLITTPMYNNLGTHWASSVPAFLTLACLPFPFLFHRYGAAIRRRCFYSADAMRIKEEMLKSAGESPDNREASPDPAESQRYLAPNEEKESRRIL